jgi:hypothetical protein
MTKRPLILLCALTLFMAAACDDDPATTDPSDNITTFTSDLLPANEVPPVTNADSTARGTVTLTLTVQRSGSNISSATADFQVNMTGFPANTTFTGAHIHPGRTGVNGGVVINTGIAAGQITVAANGSASFSRTGISVTPEIAQNLLNDPIGFYFNVHTQLNTGGAIRGQMARQ